jgi:hypothetical protein
VRGFAPVQHRPKTAEVPNLACPVNTGGERENQDRSRVRVEQASDPCRGLAAQPGATAPGAAPGGAPSQGGGPDLSRIAIHPPLKGAIQTKLAVSAPGDEYEREADRVSERIMRTSAPQPWHALAAGSARMTAPLQKHGTNPEPVQTKRVDAGGRGESSGEGTVPDPVAEVLRSPGQPLEATTRAFMEARFGHDFSGIRIHSDRRAAESAQALNALAYTHGRNIVFGAGEYSPGSSSGRRLIAHELTHVLQQSQTAASPRAPGETIAAPQAGGAPAAAVRPLGSPAGDAVIQRQAANPKRPAKPATKRTPVVEDGQRLGSGQMHKSEFLAALRDRLLQVTDAELAPVGRSAKGCPYILRTIEYYASRPLKELLRLIQVFAKPPASADAHGLIQATAAKVREAAHKLAAMSNQRVHAKAESASGRLAAHDPIAVRSQLGHGRHLDSAVRSQMESAFGANFGSVQVHTDATASRLSAQLGARAFTVGKDIAFGEGYYRPGTLPGDALIAHELAHTLQQDAERPTSPQSSDRDLEREADRAAIGAISGRTEIGSSLDADSCGLRIQRDPITDVVVAGALLVGSVGTEVAVTTTAVVVVAAPIIEESEPLIDEATPLFEDVGPLVSELAPAAQEVSPLVEQAPQATQAAVSTATAATAAATATLSSDQGEPEDEEDEKRSGVMLHAFGNQSKPRDPRPYRIPEVVKDIFVDADGNVGPSFPPEGASTFGDVKFAPLSGAYHRVPRKILDFHPAIKAIPDGADVGGPHAPTHHTIFPLFKMAFQTFVNFFQALPWVFAGKKGR